MSPGTRAGKKPRSWREVDSDYGNKPLDPRQRRRHGRFRKSNLLQKGRMTSKRVTTHNNRIHTLRHADLEHCQHGGDLRSGQIDLVTWKNVTGLTPRKRCGWIQKRLDLIFLNQGFVPRIVHPSVSRDPSPARVPFYDSRSSQPTSRRSSLSCRAPIHNFICAGLPHEQN